MASTIKPFAVAGVTALALLSLNAIAHEGQHHAAADAQAPIVTAQAAHAELKPTAGSTVAGHIRFQMEGDKIHVTGTVKGLKPLSSHGFHVHEKGDCSAPDGTSTGGHFHLHGQLHGAPGIDHNEHAGAMGNIRTDKDGVAHVDLRFPASKISLGNVPQNIIGRGLIVHHGADDLTSQPAGNSGPRAACGVIQADA